MKNLIPLAACAAFSCIGFAADVTTPSQRAGRGGFGGPISLGPDDKPAFPSPPEGFDKRREGIPHGKIELVEYDSKSVGNTRKTSVYTPPGYSTEKHYPVLYLPHGIAVPFLPASLQRRQQLYRATKICSKVAPTGSRLYRRLVIGKAHGLMTLCIVHRSPKCTQTVRSFYAHFRKNRISSLRFSAFSASLR